MESTQKSATMLSTDNSERRHGNLAVRDSVGCCDDNCLESRLTTEFSTDRPDKTEANSPRRTISNAEGRATRKSGRGGELPFEKLTCRPNRYVLQNAIRGLVYAFVPSLILWTILIWMISTLISQ
jgi:hypothetical protein